MNAAGDDPNEMAFAIACTMCGALRMPRAYIQEHAPSGEAEGPLRKPTGRLIRVEGYPFRLCRVCDAATDTKGPSAIIGPEEMIG